MIKQYKEIIICICVILFVVVIDHFTQNYSSITIDKITDDLSYLKESLINQIKTDNEEETYKNEEIIKKKIEDINKEFDEKYEVLAYYIEHEELEKVKTELVNIEANIQTEEYEQANTDVSRAIFLLDHIKQKMSLQVKNIF